MTREEAEAILTSAGEADDAAFPLLEAAIACAIHDYPLRDVKPVRILAQSACERLKERVATESPDDALSETMGSDLRLNGDLLNHDDPANTDIIDVAERRRGLSAILIDIGVNDIHVGNVSYEPSKETASHGRDRAGS